MKNVSQVCSRDTLPLLAEALGLNGSIRLPATGTSMVPAIHPGDTLTIHPVKECEVAVGDLVVFAAEEALVVHRVVRISKQTGERQLVTRGDRLLRDDAPTPWNNVLGRVVQIKRRNHTVRPADAPAPTRGHRALCQVLQRSDHATSLFLRATALWNELGSKGNMRRA
ncbi:MAG TPA: signal peptidase I [Candidatus Acidoferrum sp.]|nr:signal peptidase I [Candidatus Acidoferrum sp.]